MTTTMLPTKLRKEPLIDAIFEVRFNSHIPASILLTGVLYNKLDGEKQLIQLPVAQLPKEVRDADPNLKYAPVSRIDWADFFVSISDYSAAISCKYPYCGWKNFEPAILKLLSILNESGIVSNVERYSLKYIDLIQDLDSQQKVSAINLDVSIADHKLSNEQFHLRIEIPDNEFLHGVQVASTANVVLHNGKQIEGLLIDIDSIVQFNSTLSSLLSDIQKRLEQIHLANKKMFFNCLKPEALDQLEPQYE